MTSETPSQPTKLCQTCGTRVTEDATRCLVCGSDLDSSTKPAARQTRPIQGSRMPEITLSLPLALGLLALFLGIGAVLVYFGLQETGRVIEPTPTLTITPTLTPTTTPTPVTPTPTDQPLPTPTPLTYVVQIGDTCAGIAFNFSISIQSIVLLNNLPADCNTLYEGQQLFIPHPTPTATALPTSTLSPAESTEEACERVSYTVQENDTLSSIAAAYDVPMAVIREYNGLSSDTVFMGLTLVVPLCERNPTPGPTPTNTPPPPYAAPNLLLPSDGASLTAADETVSLQWASVGALLDNEAYEVTIIDATSEEERKLLDYVSDTKFIVPGSFGSTDSLPHAYRWSVRAARQMGTDEDGNPVWASAGADSEAWVFIWSNRPGGVTPTPPSE